MVVVISYPYYGDCFAIYTYIESLCCTLETKIMYANYASIKKKGVAGYIELDCLKFL